jgi:hypothetical protein
MTLDLLKRPLTEAEQFVKEVAFKTIFTIAKCRESSLHPEDGLDWDPAWAGAELYDRFEEDGYLYILFSFSDKSTVKVRHRFLDAAEKAIALMNMTHSMELSQLDKDVTLIGWDPSGKAYETNWISSGSGFQGLKTKDETDERRSEVR